MACTDEHEETLSMKKNLGILKICCNIIMCTWQVELVMENLKLARLQPGLSDRLWTVAYNIY